MFHPANGNTCKQLHKKYEKLGELKRGKICSCVNKRGMNEKPQFTRIMIKSIICREERDPGTQKMQSPNQLIGNLSVVGLFR